MATIKKKAQSGTTVPNDYIVRKNRVPIKDSLGNPTGRTKMVSDTLFRQDAGAWGENLKPRPGSIPPALKTSKTGKPIAKTGAKVKPCLNCGGKAKKKK